MKVVDYATENVYSIQPDDSVAHARNSMIKNGISRMIVEKDGKPVGIVTKKDMILKLGEGSAPWRRRPIDKISIKRVMSEPLITIKDDGSIKEAAEIMGKNQVSSLPVVDDEGKIVGIITSTDLIRAFHENMEGIVKNESLMTKDVVTADRYHTISHLIELMDTGGLSRIVIVDGKKPIGLVTSTDISFIILSDPKRGIKRKRVTYVRKPEKATRPQYRYTKTLPFVTAEDLMTEDLITASSSDDVVKTAGIMLENGISSIPIISKDGELQGIITKKDIIKGILMG